MPEESTRREDEEGASPPYRRVDLEDSEIALLLKACRKYRSSIPSYLQSVQDELELVNEVVEKLQDALESENSAKAPRGKDPEGDF